MSLGLGIVCIGSVERMDLGLSMVIREISGPMKIDLERASKLETRSNGIFIFVFSAGPVPASLKFVPLLYLLAIIFVSSHILRVILPRRLPNSESEFCPKPK